MRALIDNLKIIKITNFTNKEQEITLAGYKLTYHQINKNDIFYKTDKEIELHKDLFIKVGNKKLRLEIGNVTLKSEFDLKYRYDGELGYIYSKDKTKFKIFTPVAKEVKLILDEKEYTLSYQEPIWHVDVEGDQVGKKYHYLVRIEENFVKVEDPYAFAAAADGNYIIDFSETKKMIDNSPIKIKDYREAVIYEAHVRDMTMNLNIKQKGLYQGLLEYSDELDNSVIDHIKSLGITHLQLLPIYDFGGVDDINKDKEYNWGYNPRQYFSVEGWYSKDPYDPVSRINELKDIINKAHEIGLGINMDVVYNHVYEHENYPYNDLVPNYFYRHDENLQMTNSSFCGNDIETRNYMVRKLIIDSLIHFTKNFKIDGFRFDLMGLMDIETMKQIQATLKNINPNIMLYGEGWNMETVIKDIAANQTNQSKLPEYAHFNDTYRDILKGELHGKDRGYLMGNNENIEKVMAVISGSDNIFNSAKQSINYIECHDNYTTFDRMKLTGEKDERIRDYIDFGSHLIAISNGIPFYHAGQEFYRTKYGVENSYKSSDYYNMIHWESKGEHIDRFRLVLKHRKENLNHYINPDSVSFLFKKKTLYYETVSNNEIFIHILKNNYKKEKVKMTGDVLFNSKVYQRNKKNHLIINKPGIYIVKI